MAEYIDGFEEQKYADIKLSDAEQEMQKFLEQTYGLTRDEYVSIILWLDNFNLSFDNIERFEQVEDSLVKNFSLTSNDIFGIMFSHGDVFCKDYSKTQDDYEFLKDRYNLTKADFIGLMKDGRVIDKTIIKNIENGLRGAYPKLKWIPMPQLLKHLIEYANVDYVEQITYKIELAEKFDVQQNDIWHKLGFLELSVEELLTRLKLMNLTNELPLSFLNVGYRTPNAKVYKLFLRFQADAEFKKNGYRGDYVNMRNHASDFDDTQPLSDEELKIIDKNFAQRFGALTRALDSMKKPNFTQMSVLDEQEQQVEMESKEEIVDPIESGEEISYLKTEDSKIKKSKASQRYAENGQKGFVKLDPLHKYIWTYMVKNFGLTYGEYPEVAKKLDPHKSSRLEAQAKDIEDVFLDVEKDFHITRNDFGQFFKYTLYGMEQRLALLECFGITPQDLAKDNYANVPILGLGYDQLEYMLKIASIGNVKLKDNLGRMSKYNKDTFLAKYIKFYEEGSKGSMLDTTLTEREYQDIIYQKTPYYKKDKIVEKRYAEAFPVSSSFLDGYNENQRNLLMVVGFLIKKYGMEYVEAKKIVQESKANFNMHTKAISEKIDQLSQLGYDSMNIIYNSDILRLPEEKVIPRAIIAKYLDIDEETFLKHYISTSEARVFARMMGAMDIKPSYYYASEKVFSGLTGLSTKDLMGEYVINRDALFELKMKILETERKKHIESILEDSVEERILDENGKLKPYTPQEVELRDFMLNTYGVDAFSFQSARGVIALKGLSFLRLEKVKDVLEIIKHDFKMTDEDVSKLFKNTPTAFSNGVDRIINQYKYYEKNFGASRYSYRKLLLEGDESIFMRQDLTEVYTELNSHVKADFDVDISKQDFLNILRHLEGIKNLNIVAYLYGCMSLLKSYKINPAEIRNRWDFLSNGVNSNLGELETRLMLYHILDETPTDYFSSGCFRRSSELVERYLLYKQGCIPKSAIMLSKSDFEKQTGLNINIPRYISDNKKVEIAKDFAKKIKKVSFAISQEMYKNKLQENKDEIVIRSINYLTYMLAEILGVNAELANKARRAPYLIRISEAYARFMAFECFQADPSKYYLKECGGNGMDWQSLTGTKTSDLIEKYPVTEEVIDMIVNQYMMLHPEDEFRRSSEELENKETAEESEEVKINEK